MTPITNKGVRSVIVWLGFDPDSDDLIDSLRYTKSGRLRRLFGKNFKCEMGELQAVLTAVLHLSPWKEAGFNTCAFAGACAEVCIKTTGQCVTNTALRSRICKTLYFFLFREEFLDQLRMEIRQHIYMAKIKGMRAAIRLNATSDILWERTGIIDEFPEVQFYDYTKIPLEKRNPPPNYHLTFSLSEDPKSMGRALSYLEAGHNAAMVVQTLDGMKRADAKRASQSLVEAGSWNGYPTFSGDNNDIRFWDPPGSWIVLYAKGPATKDTSGFVQRLPIINL